MRGMQGYLSEINRKNEVRIMMNIDMIMTAASVGACILIYTFVGFVVITLTKNVVKGITKELMEYRRCKDSVEKTEHIYHAS